MTFLRRHGIDDRLDSHELFFVDLDLLHVLERTNVRKHGHDLIEGAEFSNLLKLITEILERKAVRQHLFLKLNCLLLIDNLFSFFNQGKNVAHSHDSGDQPVGVKQFQGVVLFTCTYELHGLAGEDRKSTRLNSSHSQISYAVFCLKKKKKKTKQL